MGLCVAHNIDRVVIPRIVSKKGDMLVTLDVTAVLSVIPNGVSVFRILI